MSKSFGEEMSQVDASNNSLGEPEPQTSTEGKSSREEKTLAHNKDMSSGEPGSHASTTNKCLEKSQVDTTIKAFGEDKPHVNATVESFGEPETQAGLTGKSGEQESQICTTDNSGDLQSQATTPDLSSRKEKSHLSNMDEPSVKEESHVSNTDESSGEEVSQKIVTDNSGDLQSQATTPDLSSRKEKSHLSNTDEPPVKEESHVSNTDESSGEEVLPTSTTENSGDLQSQGSTPDLSSSKEKSLVSNTDEPSGEEMSQKIVTDNPFGEEKPQMNAEDKSLGVPESQIGTTENSGAQESCASATVKSTGEPELQESKCPSKQESHRCTAVEQEPVKVKTDELRQRRFRHTDLHRSPTGRPEFQIGITDKSELQSQERESQGHVTGKASGESTKYKSAGESLGSTIDTESQERTIVEQGFLKVNPDAMRQRPLDTNDQESQTGKLPARYHWLIGGFIVLALAVALVHTLLSPKEKPPVDHEPVLKIFFKEFASLRKDFPGQYEGLWFRSEKLLQMHLNMSDPSAPLILMLTAAQDGERTLRCMSKRLAKSYADSLRANWLIVNGPSMSKYDSATGKMQIDDQLSSGFQSNSRAAVLHRLEMLPSGSLLILYKYCDHENAAFKKVALVLTVLLKEESLATDLSLTDVEEKVKDLLWARFASSEVSAHNEMDVDKLSGVWSRISHIVLPVLPVGSIESGSCPGIQD